MKLLLYGINFSPELTGVGKYTGELASRLAEMGHDVRVVTAPPYYPSWKVFEGYSSWLYSLKEWNRVSVYRAPMWVPKRPSGVKRILHLFSFACTSIPALAVQWRWKPDVIWIVQPPLFCAPAAALFATLRGAKSWLHIQDYEVDAAFNLGIIKGNLLRSWTEEVERWLMRRFDRVSTISDRMIQLALKKGVLSGRVVLLPNWVDISGVMPLTGPNPYRRELGIDESAVVAMYSGNMGNKQGLEILASIATLLKDHPRIQFVFGGNGSGRTDLEARCAGLTNVRFLDLQPLERLNDWLGLADVHLLPQRADAADLVMPSKLTGMMASGRPVLATADPNTELGHVVAVAASCGVIVPPENASAMADALSALEADPARRAELGSNGRRFAERELSQEVILRRFEAQLQALIQENAV